MAGLTGMADTGVVDFNAHLTSLGGSNLDVLNRQRRAGLPGDGSLSIVQHCFMTKASCAGRRHMCGGGRIELTLQVIVCRSQQSYS